MSSKTSIRFLRFQCGFLAIGVLALVIGPTIVPPLEAMPGDLDASFGTGGKVTTDFSGYRDVINAAALQPDGKIVVAGYKQDSAGESGIFHVALARYNSDGSLDTSFGSGGKVITNLNADIKAFAVAVQPDGKIIAVGDAEPDSPYNDASMFAIVRYKPNGSLDTSFGSGGQVNVRFRTYFDSARAVAVQPDGKIVVGGFTMYAPITSTPLNGSDFALARLNSDGTLDGTFGSGGKVTVPTNWDTEARRGDEIHALTILPDGRIIAAGQVFHEHILFHFSSNFDFGLTCFNPNGSLDTTFGSGGRASLDFGDFSSANSLAVQRDGRIILGGQSLSSGIASFTLARFNTDGTLDTSFGSNGRVITDFFGRPSGINALATQAGDRIVAAGFATSPAGDTDFALARHNSDGSLDASFGAGGKLITNFLGVSNLRTPGNDDVIRALVIQTDGRVVAAGQARVSDDNLDFALARYDVSQVTTPDFALTSDQPSVVAQRGTKVRVTINVVRFLGFAGNVTVTPPNTSGLGIKAKPPDAISTTGESVAFKLKITENAALGDYPLSFSGKDDSGRSHTFVLRLTVQ